MLPTPAAPFAPYGLSAAVVVIAISVLIRVITRLALCLLAAAAARKALGGEGNGQTDVTAVRAHRLAVLRAILAALGDSYWPDDQR
jgi:hypothetical protein